MFLISKRMSGFHEECRVVRLHDHVPKQAVLMSANGVFSVASGAKYKSSSNICGDMSFRVR